MGLFGNVRADLADPNLFEKDMFDDFIEQYLHQLGNDADPESKNREVFAIFASPESPAAQSVLRNANLLRLANVNVQVIFGSLSPIEEAAAWFDPDTNFKVTDPYTQFRWVKNLSLLDAHEQVVLGQTMCWSGDTMRRRSSAQDGFELFEDRAPGMARLGRLAFEALWSACAVIPANRIKVITKVLDGRHVTPYERQTIGEVDEIMIPTLNGTRH